MPNYSRAYVPGGTFFLTLVTAGRAAFLCDDRARPLLHDAIRDCANARPFDLQAMVLLPDHLHMIWSLPDGDADFSTRVASLKANFTRAWLAIGGAEQFLTDSLAHRRNRGVWQPRFWEHWVRDPGDFRRHLDYIHYNLDYVHYNPVKHGYVTSGASGLTAE